MHPATATPKLQVVFQPSPRGIASTVLANSLSPLLELTLAQAHVEGIYVYRFLREEASLRTPDVAPELRAVEEDKLTHSSQRPIVTVVIAGNSSRINRRNILQHRSFKGTYAEAGQKCFTGSPGRRWAYHWPVERELTPGSTRSGVRRLVSALCRACPARTRAPLLAARRPLRVEPLPRHERFLRPRPQRGKRRVQIGARHRVHLRHALRQKTRQAADERDHKSAVYARR